MASGHRETGFQLDREARVKKPDDFNEILVTGEDNGNIVALVKSTNNQVLDYLGVDAFFDRRNARPTRKIPQGRGEKSHWKRQVLDGTEETPLGRCSVRVTIGVDSPDIVIQPNKSTVGENAIDQLPDVILALPELLPQTVVEIGSIQEDFYSHYRPQEVKRQRSPRAEAVGESWRVIAL